MQLSQFQIERPEPMLGPAIEADSFAAVEELVAPLERYGQLCPAEQAVVKRMVHATSLGEPIVNAIFFYNDGAERLSRMLHSGATIICDTAMIAAGLSKPRLERHNNRLSTYIADPETVERADRLQTTRSFAAGQLAVERHFADPKADNTNCLLPPLLIASGNAPTFLYGAIEALVRLDINPNQYEIGFLGFPVGFVNVCESKAYLSRFLEFSGVPGVVLHGRLGSSPLVVSALHALYRLGDK